MSDSSKAVFLSYASQDNEAARKICDALREAGVEVWFDQSELVGGDAWDAKIRKQIAECALFVPVISANTQARREGYFRLEWRLAAQRTHMMSEQVAFLLPVVIDETRDVDADVPGEFKGVQWTRLSVKDTPESLAVRIGRLLSSSDEPKSAQDGGRRTEGGEIRNAPRARTSLSRWAIPLMTAAAIVLGLVIARPWQHGPDATPTIPNAPARPLSETEQLVAQAYGLVERSGYRRDDLAVAEDLLRRATEQNSASSRAWAVRAYAQSLYLLRGWDVGEKRRQDTQAFANRALVLDPNDTLAMLALAYLFNVQRVPDQVEALMRTAIARQPDDPRLRRSLGVALRQRGRWDESLAVLQEAVRRFPNDPLVRYELGLGYNLNRLNPQPELAVAEFDAALAIQPFASAYLQKALHAARQGDLAGARAALDKIDAIDRSEDRFVGVAMWVGLLERNPDAVVAAASLTTRSYLEDQIGVVHGPKAMTVARAYQAAGKDGLAQRYWQEAEALLRQRLKENPTDLDAEARLALTLVGLNRRDEAARIMARVETQLRETSGGVQTMLAAYYQASLGEAAKAIRYARMPINSNYYYSDRLLPLNPWFDPIHGKPEYEEAVARLAGPSRDNGRSALEAVKPDDKSVAVLAFANLSDDKDNEYFSDGISEELLNVLAKVPGLKVSARTSAFSFKGKGVAIPEIARQLGVAYVLEGSVRKAGSRVRITAQLIKASDGFHVWSDNFDRELKDIFAVQDEIAGLIAKNLSLTLAGGGGQRHEGDPEALRLYFEGRQLWSLRTAEALQRAEQLFRRSVTIDPKFARGYSGLADVLYIRRTNFSNDLGRFGRRDDRLEAEIISLAEQALALDPASAEAITTLAGVDDQLWRPDEAMRQYQRALALNPNYATAHQWLGRSLLFNGRVAEAVASLRRAAELDPLSPIIMDNLALALCVAGQAGEGLAAAERSLILRPDSEVTLGWQAYALSAIGRKREAFAIVPKLQRHLSVRAADVDCTLMEIFIRTQIALRLREAGAQAELRDLLAESRRRDPIAGFLVAAMAGVGAEAVPANVGNYHRNGIDSLWLPELDYLRGDSKFGAMIEQLGLTAAQERVLAYRRATAKSPTAP